MGSPSPQQPNGEPRHLELVESMGLPRERRLSREAALWFDNFDCAHVGTVAEVRARRQRRLDRPHRAA